MINQLKGLNLMALLLNICISSLLFFGMFIWTGFIFNLDLLLFALYFLLPLIFGISLIIIETVGKFVEFKRNRKLFYIAISIVNLNPTIQFFIATSSKLEYPPAFIVWLIDLYILSVSIYTLYLVIRKKVD